MLKENLQTEEDFTEKWNSIERISKSIIDMEEKDYKSILESFSLPVSINLNLLFSVFFIKYF